MEGLERSGRFLLIALIAVAAGAGAGALLGGANSDPYDTVVKTVAGGRTVTETETETETETVTKTKTKTETVTDAQATTEPVGGTADTSDDTDGDGCSDSYLGACLKPYAGIDDLDCTAISDKDFTSTGKDPYRLDPNGDGVACESH